MPEVVLWVIGAVAVWFVGTYLYGLWVASRPPKNSEVRP